jgi:ribose transport system substrate-binding protein
MPTLTRIRLAALAAATAILISACGDSSGASDSSATEASGQGVEEARARVDALKEQITDWPMPSEIANPADLAGEKVMIVSLGETIPILSAYSKLVSEALEDLGAQASVCDGKLDPTVVATCLQQAESQSYSGVIASFIPHAMAPAPFEAVGSSGAKVLIVGDTPADGKTYGENIGFFSFADRFRLLSESEADAAYAAKGTDANVLWLALSATADQVVQADALEDHFKELCETCGYVREEISTANTNQIPPAVSAALVKNPKTNFVIVPNDSYVPLAEQGIASAGFTNKVEVISNAGEAAGLQRVADGKQANDFGGPVEYDSYSIVHALVQLASGEEVTNLLPVTRNFTSDVVEDMNLDADKYFTSEWYGNDSFKAEFRKLWGAE